MMNVTISAELEELVQLKVESGRYNSAGELFQDALRLLVERDQVLELRRHELDRKIAAGLASIERGDVFDGEESFAELEAEERELERKLAQA